MNLRRRALTALCFILVGFFLSATAVLLRFAFRGPFRLLLLPVNLPINAESIIAVSFILLLLLGFPFHKVKLQVAEPIQHYFRSSAIPLALIVFITALSFWLTTRVPLLFDDYTDLKMAAHETFAQVVGAFHIHPKGGVAFFFRPLGDLTYWVDFKWAGVNPFPWHLWNLVVHILTSLLVYVLARQLLLGRFFAMISGLIFAIHGSRPEVVSWMGARYDLLAAFFVLLSLITFDQYLEGTNRRRWWYSLMVGCFVLALLSKESAYCLPLLVLGFIPFKPPSNRTMIFKTALVLLGTATAVFLYRYWLLKGIGGYKTSGEATVLQFNALRTFRGLFFREWAFLFFPINWSSSLGLWTKLAIAMFLAVLCAVLIRSRHQRLCLLSSLFIAIAATLPVQHLVLLSYDLAGSRVLYLPMLGVSIFWGLLLQGCKPPSSAIPIGVGLIASQIIILQHNLLIWREAAFLSEKTCRLLGEDLSRTGGNAVVANLPSIWHGIYFLRNGFPTCVAVNSGVSTNRVEVNEDVTKAPLNTRVFIWNSMNQRLEEEHP